MYIIHFQCTLLTDIILSSVAATEGFYKSLDYIPGAKFLGIASQSLYSESNLEQTSNIFHKGTVRFSDAHPLDYAERTTFKSPFCWQITKGKSINDGVYLSHELTHGQKVELINQGIQLKQAPSHFFNEYGSIVTQDQLFSIKSAYDSEKHRSEDEKIFGYFALRSGSKWHFSVESDQEEYLPLVEKALVGNRKIGRSTSAQYGFVKIEKITLNHNNSHQFAGNFKRGDLIFLYALSNWCFYDNFQRSIIQPSAVDHFKMPKDSQIIWEKSQVRSRPYKTWNTYRQNRDNDRQIIEKGSVISIELGGEFDSVVLQRGVGDHLSEGLGKVLVNPSFIFGNNGILDNITWGSPNTYTNSIYSNCFAISKGEDDELVLSILKSRSQIFGVDQKIDSLVNDFLRTMANGFENITNSQWGQVRNVAKFTQNDKEFKKLLFDEDFGALYIGQSEIDWRLNNCRKNLEKFLFEKAGLEGELINKLAIKLASEMAKRSKK